MTNAQALIEINEAISKLQSLRNKSLELTASYLADITKAYGKVNKPSEKLFQAFHKAVAIYHSQDQFTADQRNDAMIYAAL